MGIQHGMSGKFGVAARARGRAAALVAAGLGLAGFGPAATAAAGLGLAGLGPAATAAAGLGLAGLGPAATAAAEPAIAPAYHWCPGDDWHPEWGANWEWALCHDDHHRDIDGADHRYDFWGPPPPGVNPSIWYPIPPCGPLACWRS